VTRIAQLLNQQIFSSHCFKSQLLTGRVESGSLIIEGLTLAALIRRGNNSTLIAAAIEISDRVNHRLGVGFPNCIHLQ
jgi:hypothetical protein